tara:strand:+ start:160 stop:825 length:666 start_codon:yes stop_codon:yes gene_type:complete
MSIAENLQKIKTSLPSSVCLVAVSKTKPVEMIQAAYDAGQRVFGENKAQEMQSKAEKLPTDIEWHMIGHLQSNKVKYIAPFVHLIHSVDKLSLLKEINKRAAQNNRVIAVLLQIHIAKEESKFGLDETELLELFESDNFAEFKNTQVVGLMGMATFTENTAQIQSEFNSLKSLFDVTKNKYFKTDSNFSILSMGMSGDYEVAIEAGSNMVRIGSAIFGERE